MINAVAHRNAESNRTERESNTLLNLPLRGAPLRAKIQASHREVRERLLAENTRIMLRTAAHNRKICLPFS